MPISTTACPASLAVASTRSRSAAPPAAPRAAAARSVGRTPPPARLSAAPSRPPPRSAEGLDPSFRDLLESWCAARRSTPSPLRSTNDAVAVLADVTVIRGRPSAIDAAEMQSETELPPPGHVPPCPLDSFLYLYTYFRDRPPTAKKEFC